MTATIALPRNDWLSRLRTIGMGLAARRNILLGASGRPIAPWFRANSAPLPIAAYQPLYASDAAAARIDLTGNSYTLSPQGRPGPGWNSSQGWTYAGSYNEQMWAEFNLPASCSMVVRFTYTYLPYMTHVIMGCNVASNRAYLAPYWSDTRGKLYGLGATTLSILPGAYSGVMGFAGNRCFYNGNYVGSASATNQQFSIRFCVGGRGSTNYTASAYHVGTIACLAVYANTLTDDQMISVSNAMSAL